MFNDGFFLNTYTYIHNIKFLRKTISALKRAHSRKGINFMNLIQAITILLKINDVCTVFSNTF